jgi:hypothetical protein
MSSRYPINVDDIPDSEFFAILHSRSVYIPGDERSRTNPGHGYPASTEHYWSLEVFPTREEWESEIVRLSEDQSRRFKAFRGTSAKITRTVSVGVS